MVQIDSQKCILSNPVVRYLSMMNTLIDFRALYKDPFYQNYSHGSSSAAVHAHNLPPSWGSLLAFVDLLDRSPTGS